MASTRSASMTRAETDVRALLASVAKSLPVILIIAAIVAVAVFLALGRLTPLYRAEARLLVGLGDSGPTEARNMIAGEIQIIRSRDIARDVAASLALGAAPEYRQAIEGGDWLSHVLVTLGLKRDLRGASAEDRVLAHYDANLTVYTPDRSGLIVIAFRAEDPELAARTANAVADAYLTLRRSATAETMAMLQAEVDRVRAALAEAELRAAALRDEIAGLPPPLAAAERTALQAQREAAEEAARRAGAEAAAIRAALAQGRVPDAQASQDDPGVRALVEESRALRTELARETAANPLGNPRVAEIRARLASIDAELWAAADRIARDLEAASERDRARADELERRLAAADAATAAAAELAKTETEIAGYRDRLDTALRRQDELKQSGVLPGEVRLLSRASVPVIPDWPDVLALTGLAFLVTLILGVVFIVVRGLANGRGRREVPFEPLAGLDLPPPAAARLRRVEDDDVPRAMQDEPTLAPLTEDAAWSLGAVADSIAGRRRVVVTLAEDSDRDGRPLAAVALARALAGRDRSVVLLDLRNDGDDSVAMGEAADLPGFADLLAGEVSFAQVIFRDRRSRAHFIPAGAESIQPEALAGERLATLLAALDHTYDHIVLDCPDDAISQIAPGADAALVASEYGSADPRTVRAVGRVAKASAARIFHLKVDPGRRPSGSDPERAAEAA
jgi:uncharacterized protein involved in exopolysaccharide biosynthesis/Mrp family chromosome partitioning ATPase